MKASKSENKKSPGGGQQLTLPNSWMQMGNPPHIPPKDATKNTMTGAGQLQESPDQQDSPEASVIEHRADDEPDKISAIEHTADDELDEASMIEDVALHLAYTAQFQEIATASPTALRKLNLGHEWLRTIRPPSGQTMTSWAVLASNKHQAAIILRATEIHSECFLPHLLPKAVATPPPPLEKGSVERSEDTFRYLRYRLDLLETEKRCDQLRYELQLAYPRLDPSKSSHQRILEKLVKMQDASAECRTQLSETQLESTLIEAIEALLANFEQNSRALSDVWAANGQSGAGKKIVDVITERYNFTPRLAPTRAEHIPFPRYSSLGRAMLAPVRIARRDAPVSENMQLHGSLNSHDSRLSQQVERVCKQINGDDFNLRLCLILAIRTRLESNTTRVKTVFYKGQKITKPGTYERVGNSEFPKMDFFHDNIYHAYALFQDLKRDLPTGAPVVEIESTWLKLMAVLAICWGCTSEHALFLSTMDRLLSNLRALIGCDSNIYSVNSHIPHLPKTETASSNDAADSSMAMKHDRQLHFGELAHWVRGCIATAIALTIPKFACSESQSQDGGGRLLALRSLLTWDDTCVICGTAISWKSGKSVREVASVSMRDSRVGDVLERLEISQNRAEVYDCFSSPFSDGVSWAGDGLGPIFYSFAGLTHPECKAMRGKL